MSGLGKKTVNLVTLVFSSILNDTPGHPPQTSSRTPTPKTSKSFSQKRKCDQIYRFSLTHSYVVTRDRRTVAGVTPVTTL